MERVLESPEKRIFESWKTLEFGLCKSWKVREKTFNVCTKPGHTVVVFVILLLSLCNFFVLQISSDTGNKYALAC